MPVKVLHVIPAIAFRYGGPSITIRGLCRAQSQQEDVQVELATTDADGPHKRISAAELPSDVRVHLFRRTSSERWKYSRDLSRWLHTHVSTFDLLHIHALWSYSSMTAAKAARKASIPYVIRPAGMLSDYSLQHRALSKNIYWWLAERHTVRGAARFHATSDAEAQDITRVCGSADVSVIFNGVDDAAWSVEPQPTDLRRQLGLEHDRRRIFLYLSRLHPKKGITDLLLPAMARLEPQALLVISGGVDSHEPAYEKHIKLQVERLNLADRVILMGSISPKDRWKLFDGADAFVLPSHSENFGVVVAEAMARGCPVVISDAVQSCDHVRRSGAGLVVSRDVMSLATAMKQVLVDDHERHKMGEAGRHYASEHFNWSRIASQVRNMYTSVLST